MTFDRDWTCRPGLTLRDWMDENHAPFDTVREACGLDAETVHGVLEATVAITPAIADGLERGTQISARWWLRAESTYRDDLSKGRVEFE